MAVYAYEGIGVILPCETAMKEPQKCAAVITVVMGIAFFLYTGFGAICYLAFGKHTSDQILGMSSIPSWAEHVRVFLQRQLMA